MTDRVLTLALADLTVRHGCHTVILYGSRSRGDWTEESDYDLIGFRDEGGRLRDARVIEGKHLDAFVHSTQDVAGNERGFLKVRGGTVLIDRDGFGTSLLARLDTIFADGPEPVPEDELNALRRWIEKMLARSARGDLEGNYRRAWLSYDLLECYFVLRRRWYLGAKAAFGWLSENDPATYALFERALKPDAPFADIERLANRVLST
jgi:hypothetical protein